MNPHFHTDFSISDSLIFVRKSVLIYETIIYSYEEILNAVRDWTEYYNTERYQWDLARLSPVEYYQYMTTGIYPLIIPKAKGENNQSEASL